MVATAPGTSRSVDAVHDPLASTPRRIRRGLRGVFTQWGLPAEVAENALLVVEELVANVVDHARTPFRLTVDHTGPALHIAVHDGCPGQLHARPFSACAGRGRGLVLIAALASRWGCDRTSGGKTVWAVLPA